MNKILFLIIIVWLIIESQIIKRIRFELKDKSKEMSYFSIS
jgi:hypothetical protein